MAPKALADARGDRRVALTGRGQADREDLLGLAAEAGHREDRGGVLGSAGVHD
jgi:hypothetical protein